MKLFEMEGFLRGKCIPRDLKVNETNAEYLVRKFAEADAMCAALAAENAGLKALARGWANATDDRLFEEHGEIFHDSIDACEEELKTICPTTDAFLAEVRAQGVEMLNTQFKKCTGMLYADSVVSTAEHFAAQLRKGVQS
ncbi:hypothetical protein QL503_002028 [Salmonella enterica]|nr:hypothetical protein [Salmonella enterica]